MKSYMVGAVIAKKIPMLSSVDAEDATNALEKIDDIIGDPSLDVEIFLYNPGNGRYRPDLMRPGICYADSINL